MKRPNDFLNVEFDSCLLIEAWKLVIFQSGEMDPEPAAILGATSSFFYELICQSNQKETRDEQQLFWKNHVVEAFGDIVDEDEVKTVDWKNLYGSSMTEHINKMAKIYSKLLDLETNMSAHFNELKRQLADISELAAGINEQARGLNIQLSGMNNMY